MHAEHPDSAQSAALAERFYAASVDPSLWAGVSVAIAETLQSTSAVLKTFDRGANTQLLDLTSNLAIAPGLSDWSEHWHRHDLWVERSVGVGLSRVVTSDDLVDIDERRMSSFYQEWLRELGIHHMIGAVFPVTADITAVLGVHRAPDAPGYGVDQRHQVTFLLPHLQRALRLGQRFAETSLVNAAALEALERLDYGVMLLGEQCRIIHITRLAQLIVDGCDSLDARHGRLSVHDRRSRADLARTVADAMALGAGRAAPASHPMRISREGKLPLSLMVSPLPAGSFLLSRARPMAMVVLRDPEYPTVTIEHLQSLFGLRRSEAIVAAELARGRSPNEIARSCDIAVSTVRTHLKQILQKTGSSRQAEAVAILTTTLATAPLVD